MDAYAAEVMVGLVEDEIAFTDGREIEDLHELFIEAGMEYAQIGNWEKWVFGSTVSTTVDHLDDSVPSCETFLVENLTAAIDQVTKDFKMLGITKAPKIYNVLAAR